MLLKLVVIIKSGIVEESLENEVEMCGNGESEGINKPMKYQKPS